MAGGLVSCEWLREELNQNDAEPLRLVDATWFLPNSPFAAPEGSGGALEEFQRGPRLPGSCFFDIDAVSTPSGLPHMLPSEDMFADAMSALGICRDTRVVVYDRLGIFSAPRLWYTMKVVFDHPGMVAVLNGGLPRWQALGYPLESGDPAPMATAPTDRWTRRPESAWTMERVLDNIDSREALVLDARPAGRFKGQAPEPRAGMRGGHIPGSINVPFVSLLSSPDRTLLRPGELHTIFSEAGVEVGEFGSSSGVGRVVTSCGSGMTACIVGLALHQVGVPLAALTLYDGSWTEWGMQRDTPILRVGPTGDLEDAP